MKTLDTIPNLTWVTIKDFKDYTLPSKLLDLGLIPDTNIRIIQRALLRGMYLIELQNERSRIAIREEIAKKIVIR